MLEIQNLSTGYEGQKVLENVSLSIPAGKITVIVGPNGCGKTTLLRSIAGVHPARGTIALDGQSLSSLPPREKARKIAYLAQNRQIPQITVQRLVLHGRFPYLSYPRRYRPADFDAARDAMERLGIQDLAERDLGTLSGGQRQKVYIAMALAQDTPVVLMDEPTTFLDIPHQLQTMALARFLADQGKTVALVLHDLAMAMKCADCLVVLHRGRVLFQGTPEEAFQSGSLDEAFGIRLRRTETPQGWQYYYGYSDDQMM